MHTTPQIFDASLATLEQQVILKSKEIPVLIYFWATWCEPCKTLGPVLEKLVAEFNGGFLLAKVDVDKEQQLVGYFQIKSVPTVMLVKGGQIIDGFPGVLPEGQLREFLKHHGIESLASANVAEEITPALDPQAEVLRLRAEIHATPEKEELKLDLALALLALGNAVEAQKLLDALPANLATDDRAIKAHTRIVFMTLVKEAPPRQPLEAALIANPDDLRARHLLGTRLIIEGDAEAGLQQFLEMLRRNRNYENGLPKTALIDAFRIIEDTDLVGIYRRKMAALLF